MVVNMTTLFARGVFQGQPQTFGQETWLLENNNLIPYFFLNLKKFFYNFSSCMSYQPLSPITCSWAKNLDQLVHFFTVV